jgi:twitching motility protein PilT
MTLPELLKTLVELNGSDLHIATDTPPQVRVHGHLRRLEHPTMLPAETKQLIYSVLTDAQKKRFEERRNSTFRSASRARAFAATSSTSVVRLARFAAHPASATSGCRRSPPSPAPRGLVLVTAASRRRYGDDRQINAERHDHISRLRIRSVNPPAQELSG